MACALPAEQGVPLSRWSADELAREAITRGIVEQISGVTVWRWLCEDAIKPWQHRSWIFPRDPRFAEKAGPILDLYAGPLAGRAAASRRLRRLRRREALDPSRAAASTRRCPPPRHPRGQRVEHEYERKGALCYLAAWDARRARIFDRCAPKDGIEPFDALVDQFMSATALPQGAARVPDRRQRLSAPRPTLDRPPPRHLAQPDPRPHPDPRQLDQPSRDLLQRRPTQGPDPERLRRPRHRSSSACSPSAAATNRSRCRACRKVSWRRCWGASTSSRTAQMTCATLMQRPRARERELHAARAPRERAIS